MIEVFIWSLSAGFGGAGVFENNNKPNHKKKQIIDKKKSPKDEQTPK